MNTIRGLRARAVNVPLKLALQTAGGVVSTAPLVLIDLETGTDVTGRSYLFCYTTLALKPVVDLLIALAEVVRGRDLAPLALEQDLQRRFRLLGGQGLTGMAVAGIDMAVWDALAKLSGLPLVRLLGGEPRPVPAYNSRGLGLIGAERAAAEARELTPGFRAIKVRLGYPDIATDVSVVRTVRAAVGNDVLLMADYNQCLSVPEAIRRIQRLEDEQLFWIEEPTLADDYAGHAAIRREARAPIQIGENWWGPREMYKSVMLNASDFVMPDAMKIGGVTGWIQAAAIAEPLGLPMSCHLFPEISAHLLAVTPTAHWLEYIDWANPILREPVKVEDGCVRATEAPGTGLEWNEEGVERCLWR